METRRLALLFLAIINLVASAAGIHFMAFGVIIGCRTELCNRKCEESTIEGTECWNKGLRSTGQGRCQGFLDLFCKCHYPTSNLFQHCDEEYLRNYEVNGCSFLMGLEDIAKQQKGQTRFVELT